LLTLKLTPVQFPEAIHAITPQPGKSGYWTKVLTNTFGLAGCGRSVFLGLKIGLAGTSVEGYSLCSLQTSAYAKVSVNTIV